jgi:hypothetical protein
MIQGRLRNDTGAIIAEFNLPEQVSELKLSQYVDFVTATKRLVGEKPDDEIENPVVVMADAVHAVSGVDLNTIMQSQVGNLYLESEEMEETLRSCYGWIAKVLTAYKPKARTKDDFAFKHNGQIFNIPYIAKSPLYQRAILPNISTGQAISAYELLRLSERVKSQKGDPKGNRMFTDYLEMLAILALKEGETLPVDRNERLYHIEKMVAFFQDIPADVALDVDFFLNSTLLALKETHSIIGSLSLPLFGIGVVTKRQNAKHTRKQRHIARRSLIA